MTLEGSTLENVMREFTAPLEGVTGFDVVFERRPERDGAFTALYTATLQLTDRLPISVEAIALAHARDPVAFLTELVDTRIRPWGDMLRAAGGAACTAWQENLR